MSKGVKISLILAVISLIAACVAVFVVANNFFMGKFPQQSTIVGGTQVQDCGVSDAVIALNAAEGLQMTMEKDGVPYTIPLTGSVTRMYERDQVEGAKDSISFFDYLFHTPVEMPLQPKSVTIDEKALTDSIKKTLPKQKYKTTDAYFDTDWNLIAEIQGDNIDFDAFLKRVTEDIQNGRELSYHMADFYVQPKVRASDKKMQKIQNKVAKYKKMSITFTFGKLKEMITSENICSKLELKKGKLKLNTDWTQRYIQRLANKYNTYGTNRKFDSTEEGEVMVPGGQFGWEMDQPKTLEKLNNALKKMKSTKIEPEYVHKGIAHGKKNDIGKSYVEVSIQKQHVWVYIKGKVVLESDCVTGVPNAERMTHPGFWTIYAKQKDRYLGTMAVQGYHTHVDYFMPFHGGEGLHDAPWRHGNFGGSIYRSSGSHGCVNLPPDIAAQMYDIVYVGMPVIVFDAAQT